MATIEELNRRFSIPGVAQITSGNGGLPRVSIATPVATAEIYLHGAQVTSWRPAGHEDVIFLSRQSQFEAGKAIRGGIPVCFPWFRAGLIPRWRSLKHEPENASPGLDPRWAPGLRQILLDKEASG